MSEHRHEQTGSVAFALGHARRMLDDRPVMALEQAEAVLAAVPGHPQARLIAGQALRRLGRLDDALRSLAALAADEPRSAVTALELGFVHREQGEDTRALASFDRATALRPEDAAGWRALGSVLRLLGRETDADVAELRAVRASTRDPELVAAALALIDGRLAEAEDRLRRHLAATPADAAALRMLGETLLRGGELEQAEQALCAALASAPGFVPARELLARLLQRRHRPADALAHVEKLRFADAGDPSLALLEAALCARLGDQQRATALYEQVLARHPRQPKAWMSLGHLHRTIGDVERAIAAYRSAIAHAPALGEAWWSLANLKTFRFSNGDVAAMRAALAEPIGDEDRLHLKFALGKALEDAHDDAAAFAAYRDAARLRRRQLHYDGERLHAACVARAELSTPAFFTARTEGGCRASDPIFIVGLPRAGSTLIEQILASHSQVEGVAELPDLMAIAARLDDQGEGYAKALAALGPAERTALGNEFIARTRVHRRESKPFFIDKLPNNWMHVALIRLILPAARIIDARRHPMACGWSAFRQHFARGQDYSYDLAELGGYYRSYVMAMAAHDAALPGHVHRVIHERLVDDVEREVRAMLAYLDLPFEPACLRYWETERAIRTPSAEQVRQPITTAGLDHWRRFEPWLAPLSTALGDVVDCYPDVPAAITARGS